MRRVIGELAGVDLPVVILGESGTGKELVAELLHELGPRADGPFVTVNCAGLTETLLESELFGHERGAFTDAREMRRGQFELAHRGTLLLDEIGDMSPAGQAKLLRALETGLINRVGGTKPIPVDVRILAATNVNLPEAVCAGRFRLDLYYRLTAVTLVVPPLRTRAVDIVPLAEFFLAKAAEKSRRPDLRLSPGAKDRLLNHSWPGNARELRNVINRAAYLARSSYLEARDLIFAPDPAAHVAQQPTDDLNLTAATRQFQREFILNAITASCGNMTRAAERLGLLRTNLYRKMRLLGLPTVTDPTIE
ncbi:MAG: hypothetical protein B7Z55_15885 [Planctomycetales bacterium 12-60-4]|nr:MAG: hypothetical protein B7Z55_15885 [Planctomycetales bacterium 12-60-4]